VEDNADNRDLLVRRLSRRGYDVTAAGDGEEGARLARELHPDIIIMDMSLPVLDGWSATRRLKEDPTTAGIPVVALTAHAMTGDRERALSAGCDAFEPKPVDMTHLLATLSALLKGRSPS